MNAIGEKRILIPPGKMSNSEKRKLRLRKDELQTRLNGWIERSGGNDEGGKRGTVLAV